MIVLIVVLQFCRAQECPILFNKTEYHFCRYNKTVTKTCTIPGDYLVTSKLSHSWTDCLFESGEIPCSFFSHSFSLQELSQPQHNVCCLEQKTLSFPILHYCAMHQVFFVFVGNCCWGGCLLQMRQNNNKTVCPTSFVSVLLYCKKHLLRFSRISLNSFNILPVLSFIVTPTSQ